MVFHTVLEHEQATTTEPPRWSGAVAEALRDYVSNPLFRSASFDELVIDDNPYRRPVRPDDLEWLLFEEPVTRENSSQLSALLGHRMLLNIYDSRSPQLPENMTEDKWRDFGLFYGSDNRIRGEQVRGFLENHLFDFVRAQALRRGARAGDAAGLAGALHELRGARREAAAVLDHSLASAADRSQASTMAAVQLLGPALVLAGLETATALIGDDGQSLVVGQLTSALGLQQRAHRYWQFYLPSTLALMNFLAGRAADPRDVYLLAGAVTAYRVDLCERLGAFDLSAAAIEPDTDRLAQRVATRGGPHGVREFARGLSEFGILLSVHDDDVQQQLHLVDNIEMHQRKAQRLYTAISAHDMPVALDTFIESHEECSTTHVHDDHRLVVIESGEMEFWTCLGQRIVMIPGDMIFVPRHRLHGSVVQSGECVYHQPIISPAFDEQHG
jgi:hypothetical protein